VADTEGVEARKRARAAMDRLGQRLAAGEPPDASVDRDLAELAVRLDANLWKRDGTETSGR